MEINKKHKLRNRILYTIFVIAIYILGRNVLLYGIIDDRSPSTDVQSFVTTMLSGDQYQITIMALGIMPFLNASLLVQVISSLGNSSYRAKISKKKSERWMFITTIVIAIIMSVILSANLTYRSEAGPSWVVRSIVIIEMFAGSMLTYWLCKFNEKHGIGASMPIVLVNILSVNIGKLSIYHFLSYWALILICIAVVILTIFMENKLIKLPLQRVSIHNIHADKNYIAYKMNPIGIMPVMFATAAFLVPVYIFRFLTFLYPQNEVFANIYQNMDMNKPIGICVYLVTIIVLAVLFAFIMLNPREMARQLKEHGDSIIGLYAGKKTSKYLILLVLKWSIISGVLQAACMSVSLILAYQGNIPTELSMIPSVAMILVSIICSLIQEIGSYYRYDVYKFFI